MSGKRYRNAKERVEGAKAYPLDEAVALLNDMPAARFDESVELSILLGIDSKQTDQVVRGTVMLPHGTGKSRRIIVFCRGEQEIQAKQAGADYVGGGDLIEKIQQGWLDFDVVIAAPSMMREVSRLGKILGPRGLMPSPKAATVTDDVAKAIAECKSGKIEFKMDKQGIVHFVIGRRSFKSEKLVENVRAAIEAVARARPSSAKGRLFRTLHLSSTMSPSILLRTEDLEESDG